MKTTEIKLLSEAELKVREAQVGEQLFRLRFQKSLGSTEGTTKLRTLRKDIARIKTIARQRIPGFNDVISHDIGVAGVLRKSKKGK